MGVPHEAAPCGLCKRHGPSKTFAPVFLRSSTPESWCRRTAGTNGPYLRYRKRKARNDRAATIPWRAGEIGLLLDGSRWLLARKEGQPGSSPSSSSSEPSGTSDGRGKPKGRQQTAIYLLEDPDLCALGRERKNAGAAELRISAPLRRIAVSKCGIIYDSFRHDPRFKELYHPPSTNILCSRESWKRHFWNPKLGPI